MWKIILKKLAKVLIPLTFSIIFNAIDKNKDGTLDKKEISEFIKELNRYIRKLRK